MRENFKKSGFTMAEAILVMTILGIIATIMITTMKPAQFKEKGYQILAKQIFADIDNAVQMVIMNDTPYNTLEYIYSPDRTKVCSKLPKTDGHSSLGYWYFSAALQKYLQVSRKNPYGDDAEIGTPYDNSGEATATNITIKKDIFTKTTKTAIEQDGMKTRFYLKNGAYIHISAGNAAQQTETIVPGEKETKTIYHPPVLINLDINGEEEPNVLGKDQFIIPYDKFGGIASGD